MGTLLLAYAAWLRLTAARDIGGAALAQHPLVTAALQALGTSDAFDAGVDAVVELVFVTSTGAQPEPDMMPLVARLVPAVPPAC